MASQFLPGPSQPSSRQPSQFGPGSTDYNEPSPSNRSFSRNIPVVESGGAEGMPARVQVVVRVRPALDPEAPGDVSTRQVDPRHVEVLSDMGGGEGKAALDMGGGARIVGKGKVFGFDACVGGPGTQAEVYEACRMPALIESAVDGYSVTLFAYGQTGSGKTHTVVGPRYFPRPGAAAPEGVGEEDGLLPRSYAAAFASIQRRMQSDPNTSYSLHLTCVEIYNEQVTDLMAGPSSMTSTTGPTGQTKSLAVRHDRSKGFYVEGLARHPAKNLAAALALVHQALARRAIGSHKLNQNSTRSHLIMTLHVDSERTDRGEGGSGSGRGGSAAGGAGPGIAGLSRQGSRAVPQGSGAGGAEDLDEEKPAGPGRRFGKLVLVDLAGSERLKETGQTEESSLREAGNINRSLFSLGKVLSALSTRGRGVDPNEPAVGFVPYRDSKLTQLLYDGIKGTGRVLMVACCAPTRAHTEETLNTLHFAQVALHIKSEPVVVLDPHDQLVVDLKSTIVQLKAENRKLAKALKEMADGKDLGQALRSSEGPELSGTLRNVLGMSDGAPLSPFHKNSPLHRPKSMPALAHTLSVYGGKPGSKKTGGRAKQMLRLDGVSAGDGGPSSDAFPPIRRANANNGPKREKLQNLKKLNQQLWKAKGVAQGGRRTNAHPEGPGGGAGGAASDMPLEDFPELAALEMQFQQRLAEARGLSGIPSGADVGGGGAVSDSGAGGPATHVLEAELSTISEGTGVPVDPGASPGQPQALLRPQSTGGGGGGAAASAGGGGGGSAAASAKTGARQPPASARNRSATGGQASTSGNRAHVGSHGQGRAAHRVAEESAEEAAKAAEPKAVRWAEKNKWFGADVELTAYAYEIHDNLVEVEGVDPNSDKYYDELDRRMYDRFPTRLPPPTQPVNRPPHALGPAAAKLKARLMRDLSPPKLLAREPAPVAGRAVPRQAWNARLRQGDKPPANEQLNELLGLYGGGSAAAVSAARRTSLIGLGQAPGGKSSPRQAWAGDRGDPKISDATFATRGPGHVSVSDYARSRAQIMNELRAAKDEAEAERRALMREIGTRLNAARQGGAAAGWVS